MFRKRKLKIVPVLSINNKSNEQNKRKITVKPKHNDKYTIMFDGGSRGNPGVAGCGFVIYNDENKEVEYGFKNIGINTNNVAEYMALYLALTVAKRKGYDNLIIKGDSLLVINQLKGLWKVKNSNLKKIHSKIKDILKNMGSYNLLHIKRDLNKRADHLANIAMDENTN